MKKSLEPRWNQTFMYSPVHQREFKERLLELTVWDQARVREEESQFLGEVRAHIRTERHTHTALFHRLSACCVLAPCCCHGYDNDVAALQVLVQLDSALLDEQPHWYQLQLHDGSSLPLPNASPYLQRRVLQSEDSLSSRRLQSETHTHTHGLLSLRFVDFVSFFSHDALPDKGPYFNSGNSSLLLQSSARLASSGFWVLLGFPKV